jgi:hypothetical protein
MGGEILLKFVFTCNYLYITGQCPVNMNNLAPKIGTIQTSLKYKNCNFFGNDLNGSDYFSLIKYISLN